MVLVLRDGATKEEMAALEEKLRSLPTPKGIAVKGMEAKKYSGTIRLKEDPLAIQKKLRDEWG